MEEMSFENKIKMLKKIQRWTSNWSDDKVVGKAIKAMEKLLKIEQIIESHDNDSMPEDYFYIDKIREVLKSDSDKRDGNAKEL